MLRRFLNDPASLLGQPVEDFSLPSTGGDTFQLSSARGRRLVLYFYPKDNTPGCTAEGADFRDRYAAFRAAGCEVLGVSRVSSMVAVDNERSALVLTRAGLRWEAMLRRYGRIDGRWLDVHVYALERELWQCSRA